MIQFRDMLVAEEEEEESVKEEEEESVKEEEEVSMKEEEEEVSVEEEVEEALELLGAGVVHEVGLFCACLIEQLSLLHCSRMVLMVESTIHEECTLLVDVEGQEGHCYSDEGQSNRLVHYLL